MTQIEITTEIYNLMKLCAYRRIKIIITEIFKKFNELIKFPDNENTADFPSNNLIFRGQSDASWGLLPKLFREEYKNNCEKTLIDKYKRHYNIINNSYIDNLTDMQHYGMPTKLLDWSRNILIGIFFAVENNPDKNGKLFILDKANLNSYTHIETYKSIANLLACPSFTNSDIVDSIEDIKKLINNYESIAQHSSLGTHLDETSLMTELKEFLNFDCLVESLNKEQKLKLFEIITKPIILEPTNLNPRVLAQSSLFTYSMGENGELFHHKPFDLGSLIDEKKQYTSQDNNKDINMAYILIPAGYKEYIQKELKDLFNISSSTVYPDDKEKILSQYIDKNKNKNEEQLETPKLFISQCY